MDDIDFVDSVGDGEGTDDLCRESGLAVDNDNMFVPPADNVGIKGVKEGVMTADVETIFTPSDIDEDSPAAVTTSDRRLVDSPVNRDTGDISISSFEVVSD